MASETITIHATYRDIRRPSERLRILLSGTQASEEVINHCELALQELLANLVDHAYEGDGSKTINVMISCNGSSVLIETRDSGKPAEIDMSHKRMPDPAELAEGGYGIAIIHALMDKVSYRYEQGVNIWNLIKRFR